MKRRILSIITLIMFLPLMANAATKYTITYELNKGINNKYNPSTYTVKDAITFKNPTRKGGIFKGWYKDPGFTKQVIGIKKGTTGNRTFYARWAATKYSITYNRNGGTGTMAKSTGIKYNTNFTLRANAFKVKKGYVFKEWNTKADGTGKAFANKAVVRNLTAKNGGNVNLYARWAKIKYKITYELNKGVNNKANPTIYNVKSEFTLKNPTRTGGIFKGWYSDSGFTKKVTGIKKGTTGNKKFYARWAAIKYNVVFNSNGGTGTMTGLNLIKYNTTYTLSSNTFKKDGYKFTGWNTKADGTGTAIENGGQIRNLTATNGATVTLYAQWKKEGHSITYNLDGGTNNQNNVSIFTPEEEVTLYDPNKRGYSFEGWYLDSDFNEAIEKIEVGTDNDVVLYAKWIVISYNITYHLDGGTNDSYNPATYTVEEEVPLFEPSKDGFSFYGWFADEGFNDKVNKIEEGTIGNIDLYAKWGTVKYRIEYILYNGTNSPNNVEYFTADDEVTLYNPTRDGYTFGGWYLEDGFANQITKIEKGTTHSVGVYAKWNLIDYDITYHLDGGTNNGLNPDSYNVEDEVILYPASKDGYSFYGWFTDENLKNEIGTIEEGTTGNIDLYAKWGEIRYEVNYVLNGGTNSPDNIQYFNAEDEFTFKPATQLGYIFQGWYTDEDCTQQITGVELGTTSDITVYAKWELEEYTIKYVLYGGTNDPNNVTSYTIDDRVILHEPTLEGYNFVGWSLDSQSTDYITEIPYGSTGNISLYAKWEPITYHITYVLNGGVNDPNNLDTIKANESMFLHTPMRDGYRHEGWYLDPEFTQPIEEIAQPTHDITVYANWYSTSSNDDALARALRLLSERAYSYDALVYALEEWDSFDHNAAVYAVENCGANWNQQAARRAEEICSSGFRSKQTLKNTLIQNDQFSEAQADYAILNADIDWTSQAQGYAYGLICDEMEPEYIVYTHEELISMMLDAGFDQELAEIGAAWAESYYNS